MNLPGDQFLAGSIFTRNQDGGVSCRDLFDEPEHLLHGWGIPDELATVRHKGSEPFILTLKIGLDPDILKTQACETADRTDELELAPAKLFAMSASVDVDEPKAPISIGQWGADKRSDLQVDNAMAKIFTIGNVGYKNSFFIPLDPCQDSFAHLDGLSFVSLVGIPEFDDLQGVRVWLGGFWEQAKKAPLRPGLTGDRRKDRIVDAAFVRNLENLFGKAVEG